MKELLILIVGRNVLNGESSQKTVIKLAKTVDYLYYQLNQIKKFVKDDKTALQCIDDILENSREIINDTKD